ncbi:MAG: DUF3617 family protein [Parvibaculum sp.]|uniref:DUF3617 domain-containing protein n=1 Tax=Parvibaculum sp. TaxID=2024848 RepID=UPI003C76B8A4
MKKAISMTAAVFLLPVAAIAAPPKMAPGLWERTMTIGGTSFSDKECFSPEDVKQSAEQMLRAEGEQMENCKVKGSWQGNVYHFTSECSMPEEGATITMTGSMDFVSPTHMVQASETKSSVGGMSQTMSAKVDHKRIGDCTE